MIEFMKSAWDMLIVVFYEFIMGIRPVIVTSIFGIAVIIWRLPSTLRQIDRLSLRVDLWRKKLITYEADNLIRNRDNAKVILAEIYGYASGRAYDITHISMYYAHNGDKQIYGKYADKFSMLCEHGYDSTFIISNQNISTASLKSVIDSNRDKKVVDIYIDTPHNDIRTQMIKHNWQQLSILTHNNDKGEPLLVVMCYFRSTKSVTAKPSVNIKGAADIINKPLNVYIERKLHLVHNFLINDTLSIATFN